MRVDLDLIRKLREETGAPVMRVKKVLEECDNDVDRALSILREEGFEKAEKRSDRATSQGLIASYVHHSRKVAALVELLCETDFVAKTEIFQTLAYDLAMQVASMSPTSVEDLLSQDFVKDSSKKVSDVVKESIAKTGENIRVGRIFRLELGKLD